MEFIAEYASFLAKTVTLVVAILVVLITAAALRSRAGARVWGSCRSAS